MCVRVCVCACVRVCAQCYLKIGENDPDGIESKEARKAFMKANMDAGFFLDSLYYRCTGFSLGFSGI